MLETNVMVHVRFPIRSIETSAALERFVHRSTAERRLTRRSCFAGQIDMDPGGGGGVVVAAVTAEIVIGIDVLVTVTAVADGSIELKGSTNIFETRERM